MPLASAISLKKQSSLRAPIDPLITETFHLLEKVTGLSRPSQYLLHSSRFPACSDVHTLVSPLLDPVLMTDKADPKYQPEYWMIQELEQFIDKFPMSYSQRSGRIHVLLDAYLPLERKGEGTFSTVYLALDLLHSVCENQDWLHASYDAPLRENTTEQVRSFCVKEQHQFRQLLARLLLKMFQFQSKLFPIYYTFMKPYLIMDETTGRYPPPPPCVALKRITLTSSPRRVLDEIDFLKRLGGENHVAPLVTAFRAEDQIIVVFPYFRHDEVRDYLYTMTLPQIAKYMKLLCQALQHIHEQGVVHRDVKPSNFLYCQHTERGLLVDFGLAEDLKQEQDENTLPTSKPCFKSDEKTPGLWRNDTQRPVMRAPRAGTRGFRAPEVLFKVMHQTAAIDMWSVGVILLSMLTRHFPFFHAPDDQEAIVELACLVGDPVMQETAHFYQRIWYCHCPGVPKTSQTWRKVIESFRTDLEMEESVFDFCEKLLVMKDKERMTAKEALRHEFITKHT